MEVAVKAAKVLKRGRKRPQMIAVKVRKVLFGRI